MAETAEGAARSKVECLDGKHLLLPATAPSARCLWCDKAAEEIMRETMEAPSTPLPEALPFHVDNAAYEAWTAPLLPRRGLAGLGLLPLTDTLGGLRSGLALEDARGGRRGAARESGPGIAALPPPSPHLDMSTWADEWDLLPDAE